MNRALSIRSRKNKDSGEAPKHRFAISSLRGVQQPELSKKLYKLIKSENHAIAAYDTAAREQHGIATQLSDWGESTEDDAVSEISDKLGVLLAEIAEQEDAYAQGLEESRTILKQIRNTESSVQPTRDTRTKIQDEIAKLKHKEPTSTKLPQLEQELVRAEAQSLVAEAQLTNTTRLKLREAYLSHTAALIERCEKQAMLARHARDLLQLLDVEPVQPGDTRPAFDKHEEARNILNDAEADLRSWSPSFEDETEHQLQEPSVTSAVPPASTVVTEQHLEHNSGVAPTTTTDPSLSAASYATAPTTTAPTTTTLQPATEQLA